MRPVTLSALLGMTLALPAQFPLGHATTANGFAPALFAGPLWLGNSAYGYRIQGAPPAGAAIIAVSLGRQDQVINGLQAYLDLANLVVTHFASVDATGQASVSFPLGSPDDPALTGLQCYAQAAVSNPGAPGSLATTEALLLEVTLHPMLAFSSWAGTLWLLDPVTGQMTAVTGLAPSTIILDAIFANAGRDLFVATSTGVFVVDTLGSAPSAVSLTSGSWSSIGWDRAHHRAYAVSTQSITVFEGDRASLAFGSTILQVPATSNESSLAVSTDGGLIALATVDGVVTRLDGDPASPTYLQNIPTPPSPGAFVSGAFAGRVHVSPDGRVVSLPMTQIALPTPVVHRFDGVAGAWLDHNPAAPGSDPLSSMTNPSLPFGSQVFPARDGSALVLGGANFVGRINLDLHSPASLTIATTPTLPTFGSTYCAVTPSGAFLIRRTSTLSNPPSIALSFVQVATGGANPFVTIPAATTFETVSVAAWR